MSKKFTVRAILTALTTTPKRFLRLDELCEVLGESANTATTEGKVNLWALRDAVEAAMKASGDLFDLGAQDLPMLVSQRGSKDSHGIEFAKAEMPDDPRVTKRAPKLDEDGNQIVAKQVVNYIPAVRMVSAADWARYTSDSAIKESLRTGVLKTISDLPDSFRIMFGDVKDVKPSPTEGWALATVLIKLG